MKIGKAQIIRGKTHLLPGDGVAILLGLLAFVTAVPDLMGQSCFTAPSGIVGWWPGDGNANDAASTNNGVLEGGAGANALGIVGMAFDFDGTNGYVQIPDCPAFHPANLTVETWVNFSSLDSAGNTPAGQQYLVFKQNTLTYNFEGFSLTKVRQANDVFMFEVTSASGESVEVTSATVISVGTWYHVAGVRGSNYLQLYINGVLESQTNVDFPQDYGTLPLFLGSSGQSYWDHKLAGNLDEVSLYDRALDSDEIAGIYAAGAAGKCKPVAILTQPRDQTVAAGANVSFSVKVCGSPCIGYQWLMNGTNLADAGNVSGCLTSALNLTNVQTNDSAYYSVVITNSVNVVTSAVAVLNVGAAPSPPVILTTPSNLSVFAGTNLVLPVSASGSGPLTYLWQFNGSPLTDGGQFSGTSNSTLSVNFVLPPNAGVYSVVVSNSLGSATGAVATLTVNVPTNCDPMPPGVVGWWPGDGDASDIVGTNNGILQGGALANTPGVCGTAFLLDGTNAYAQIPNAPELNPAVLSVECWVRFDLLDTPGTSTPGAQYIVFKQNTRSNSFEGYNLSKHRYAYDIFVWEASSAEGVATQLNGVTSIAAGVWYHVVGVRGSNFMQLYVNGQLEAEGAINYPQDYGDYPLYFGTSNESYWDHKLGGALDEVCLYNRPLGSDEVAALYDAGPAGKYKGARILTQPQGQLGYWGGSITLTATVAGVSPVSCQWFKDGVPVAGATNATLALNSLQLTDAGSYVLQASNLVGMEISSAAPVNVKVADLSAALSSNGYQTIMALTIGGLSNQIYGVQYTPVLGTSNTWIGLTNLTLTGGAGLWYDPQPATQPSRFYRIVPGPISIP